MQCTVNPARCVQGGNDKEADILGKLVGADKGLCSFILCFIHTKHIFLLKELGTSFKDRLLKKIKISPQPPWALFPFSG